MPAVRIDQLIRWLLATADSPETKRFFGLSREKSNKGKGVTMIFSVITAERRYVTLYDVRYVMV